jgi:hypothetical protein
MANRSSLDLRAERPPNTRRSRKRSRVRRTPPKTNAIASVHGPSPGESAPPLGQARPRFPPNEMLIPTWRRNVLSREWPVPSSASWSLAPTPKVFNIRAGDPRAPVRIKERAAGKWLTASDAPLDPTWAERPLVRVRFQFLPPKPAPQLRRRPVRMPLTPRFSSSPPKPSPDTRENQGCGSTGRSILLEVIIQVRGSPGS